MGNLSERKRKTLDRYFNAVANNGFRVRDAAKELGVNAQTIYTFKFNNKEAWDAREKAFREDPNNKFVNIPSYLRKRKVPSRKDGAPKSDMYDKYIGTTFEIGKAKPAPKLKVGSETEEELKVGSETEEELKVASETEEELNPAELESDWLTGNVDELYKMTDGAHEELKKFNDLEAENTKLVQRNEFLKARVKNIEKLAHDVMDDYKKASDELKFLHKLKDEQELKHKDDLKRLEKKFLNSGNEDLPAMQLMSKLYKVSEDELKINLQNQMFNVAVLIALENEDYRKMLSRVHL